MLLDKLKKNVARVTGPLQAKFIIRKALPLSHVAL